MKTLEEKKLLVKMAQMLGQPVDPALVESIKREEYLNRKIFEQEQISTVEPKVVLQEEAPPPPAPAFVPPVKDTVQQVANMFKAPAENKFRDIELEGMRRSIAEMMKKISTLSWGGGGTGVVRIHETDDFDKTSYAEGRYLKWSNGMFRLDDINSQQVVYNTTTTATNYTIADNDYYIGVTAVPVTITLPSSTDSGRTIVIKDETGNCRSNNITIAGTIDNDAGGVILAINNGAVQLLFRNGWRII
jgi:hypothetical protein